MAIIASSSLLAAPKWIDPPRKNCTSNGGKLAEGGVCEATWENATTICASLGAKLPTIEQLRKEVENCGGVVWERDNNINDPAYQSCYKNKGFSSADAYWSSSPSTHELSNQWKMYFGHGVNITSHESLNGNIRCVRAGQ